MPSAWVKLVAAGSCVCTRYRPLEPRVARSAYPASWITSCLSAAWKPQGPRLGEIIFQRSPGQTLDFIPSSQPRKVASWPFLPVAPYLWPPVATKTWNPMFGKFVGGVPCCPPDGPSSSKHLQCTSKTHPPRRVFSLSRGAELQIPAVHEAIRWQRCLGLVHRQRHQDLRSDRCHSRREILRVRGEEMHRLC